MIKNKKPLSKQIRPLGNITTDLETLLFEMGVEHDLQWHEILGLVHSWLQTHFPHGQETYVEDGSHPVFYYGPKK